jgi:hypothetical protein
MFGWINTLVLEMPETEMIVDESRKRKRDTGNEVRTIPKVVKCGKFKFSLLWDQKKVT